MLDCLFQFQKVTVSKLKMKLAEIGLTGDYWLQYGGRPLEGDKCLSEYNICTDSELFVFYRVHGGLI